VQANSAVEGVKTFDPYEVIGIITPGTVLALLFALESPALHGLMVQEGFGVGDLGLFVLIAFVLGHLVQAVGNLLEPIVWLGSGLPTNLVRNSNQTLLSPYQRTALAEKINAMENAEIDLPTIGRKPWRSITTRAYARVRSAGRSHRVDISNRTYGLSRGLVASLIVALAWYLYDHNDQRGAITLLAMMLLAAVWRMRVAGLHYARALFLEFIDLDRPITASAERPATRLPPG
jgi:hypothetical protein